LESAELSESARVLKTADVPAAARAVDGCLSAVELRVPPRYLFVARLLLGNAGSADLGACRVQCKIWARCETIPFSRTMQRMAHRAVLSIPKRFAPATTLNFSKVGYGT
jgi:hypothetical protein